MTESTLEFDYLYFLEFDPLVETYEMQPVKIPIINAQGKESKYVPDVKVIYSKAGAKLKGYKYSLIEIKYLEALEDDENEQEFEIKFKAAREYCKKAKSSFEVVHEGEIRTQRLATYKFLYRYLKPKRVPKLNIDFNSLAKNLGQFNAYDWVNRIEGSDRLKGEALSNMWHMVAKGELHIDWDGPVNNTTIITAKS